VSTIRVHTKGGHQFSGETWDNWEQVARDDADEANEMWLEIEDGNYKHVVRMRDIVAVTTW
jgi:hypothetical protein